MPYTPRESSVRCGENAGADGIIAYDRCGDAPAMQGVHEDGL